MANTKQLAHFIDGQWERADAACGSLNPSDTLKTSYSWL
jgi:hypothetical protein